MPKEKRNNLAIYTLAGSILLSSVIVSMNQVNAHSTSATKKEFNALKKCINEFSKNTAEFYEWTQSEFYGSENRQESLSSLPKEWHEYLGGETDSMVDDHTWLAWIADGLEC